MDFNDTQAEAAFRCEVRSWLAREAPAFTSLPPVPHTSDEYVARGRAWQKLKAASGYAAIGLPKHLGGRDATAMMEVIFAEEEGRCGVPGGNFITIGTQLALPTIHAVGTTEQGERYTQPTLNGDLLWCQLFSEPAAGSDLAGMRTRAVRVSDSDGDGWIINGQKVWTSWAQVADWGILLARTNPDLPKHRGLTYFLLDMRTPGVEVRPIRQISGEPEFNEVFLSDVRIPDACRLGAVDDGWKAAMLTLMSERISVGGESSHLPDVDGLIRLANRDGALARHGYRMRIAQLAAQEQGLRFFRFRLLTQLSRGETLGAIAALGKLVYANILQDLSSIAMDLGEIASLYPDGDAEAAEKFHHGYFWGAALRIAGGTDEILRNQLAERVLGLPGDLRIDRDIAFNALPSGS